MQLRHGAGENGGLFDNISLGSLTLEDKRK